MLSTANVWLIAFLLLGLAARSNLLAAAATVLLAIRLTGLAFLLPRFYEPALFAGLLFLTVAMLTPFALGKVSLKKLGQGFTTLPGIVAVVGSAVATHLNGHSITLMNTQSHLMINLIAGSILGIVLWGGMPVGPLTAAGVTYLMLECISWITHWVK